MDRFFIGTDKLILGINSVIIEAIRHGGDGGGAYFSCHRSLCNAMKGYLRNCSLQDVVEVKDVFIKEFMTEVPQFAMKGD